MQWPFVCLLQTEFDIVVTVYTDGSCLGNPGPGGWAYYIVGFSKMPMVGGNKNTTNNRMEITAIIQALLAVNTNEPITIKTDSQYVINTITKGWKRNKNKDLWDQLDKLLYDLDVTWEWVKAHSTDEYNNKVDRAARQAATTMQHSNGV